MFATNKRSMPEEIISIDFKSIAKLFYNNLVYFLAGIIVFTLPYVLYSVNKKTQFAATIKILPEIAHQPNNGLASLLEMASNFAKKKELYSQEITSPTLYKDILLTDKYFSKLSKDIPESKLLNFPKTESGRNQIISVTTSNNKLTSITATTFAPNLSEKIVEHATHYLLDFLINYRKEKSLADLKFIQAKYIENKNNAFGDNLAKLILLQEIKVQEDTPVFQTLGKPETNKLKNFRLIEVTCLTVLGVLLTAIIILLKNQNYRLIFISEKIEGIDEK